MSKKVLFFVLAVLQLPSLSQQKPAEKQPAQAPLTLRTETHLVNLDVVALDNQGQPVKGLGRGDFVVLEDGKPQQIKQFDVHMAADAAPPEADASKTMPAPATLAPNEFRNIPVQVPNAVNVILFDVLSTARQDQQEARRHMLRYLQTMPKGRQVALYALDTRLHLIQNFTGSSDTLIAAAEKALAAPSVLKQSTEDKEADGEFVATLRALGNDQGAERMKAVLKSTEVSKTDLRVGLTVQALEQIARSLSGIPGRKNLIWLSSGFPLKIEGEFGNKAVQGTLATPSRDYTQAILQVTSILTQAQIAVYPVDVAGLNVNGVGATSDGRGLAEMSTRRDDPVVDPITSSNVTEAASSHNSMELIAKDTGGQAFYNGNDLKSAIGRSMDIGSSYYTLAYTPTNNEWNGALRKIEVKVAGKKLKLFYRHSYYALADRHFTVTELEQALVSSMDPEIADSTMLSVDVKVSPGTKGSNSVILECDFDRSQFQFVDVEKQKVAMIDLAIESWDRHGKASGRFGQTLKIQADATHSKVGFRQELVLRPNTTTLRVGILDRASGRIGTVEVSSLPFAAQAEGKLDTKPEAKP